MHIKNTYKKVPYYKPNINLGQQIVNSKGQKKIALPKFVLKKIKNELFARLAYNCPISSWRIKLHRARGVNIGNNVHIGRRVTLDNAYPEYIYLEDNVSLSGDNYILAHSIPYEHFKNFLGSYVAPVIIKKGAWVAIMATVLPGVTIGKNAIIGAGVVVNKNVPDSAIVTLNKNKVIIPKNLNSCLNS